jgi:hypothetical protein
LGLLLIFSLTALVLLFFKLLNLFRMIGLELLAQGVGVGLIKGEVGADFVLQAEFPFVGFGGVVLPEAASANGRLAMLAALDTIADSSYPHDHKAVLIGPRHS